MNIINLHELLNGLHFYPYTTQVSYFLSLLQSLDVLRDQVLALMGDTSLILPDGGRRATSCD